MKRRCDSWISFADTGFCLTSGPLRSCCQCDFSTLNCSVQNRKATTEIGISGVVVVILKNSFQDDFGGKCAVVAREFQLTTARASGRIKVHRLCTDLFLFFVLSFGCKFRFTKAKLLCTRTVPG